MSIEPENDIVPGQARIREQILALERAHRKAVHQLAELQGRCRLNAPVDDDSRRAATGALVSALAIERDLAVHRVAALLHELAARLEEIDVRPHEPSIDIAIPEPFPQSFEPRFVRVDGEGGARELAPLTRFER